MTARSSSPHPLHIYILVTTQKKKKNTKKQQQLKYTKSNNMTYCKPSWPFQVEEGGERVDKEGGKAMKEKKKKKKRKTKKKRIEQNLLFVHLLYLTKNIYIQ